MDKVKNKKNKKNRQKNNTNHIKIYKKSIKTKIPYGSLASITTTTQETAEPTNHQHSCG